MRIVYRYLRPLSVVFVRSTGPYEKSAIDAWSRMLGWLDDNEMRATLDVGIGFMRDNPSEVGPFLRRYDACVAVRPGVGPDLAAGIGRQTLPGGAFAAYSHVGSHVEIPRLFSQLHRDWVPRRGLSVDYGRPFIEIYKSDPAKIAAGERVTELLVPVGAVIERAGTGMDAVAA